MDHAKPSAAHIIGFFDKAPHSKSNPLLNIGGIPNPTGAASPSVNLLSMEHFLKLFKRKMLDDHDY